MKTLLKSVAAAAVLVAAGAAHAVPTTVTATILLAPAAVVNGTLNGAAFQDGAGLLQVNTVEMGSFAAFCIELDVGLPSVFPTTYDFGAYSQDGVARILGQYLGGSYSAAATQVAIWEAIYDTVPGNLAAGNFTVNAPGALITEANTLLAAAGAMTVGSYDPNGLRAFTSKQYQDLVVAVPEPSTYALLLAGLAGVGFVARRRSQAGN